MSICRVVCGSNVLSTLTLVVLCVYLMFPVRLCSGRVVSYKLPNRQQNIRNYREYLCNHNNQKSEGDIEIVSSNTSPRSLCPWTEGYYSGFKGTKLKFYCCQSEGKGCDYGDLPTNILLHESTKCRQVTTERIV